MKIAICGSMVFAREMKKARKFLEEKGHRVITPVFVDDWADGKLAKRLRKDAKIKKDHDLIRDYYQKIKSTDAVLVLNYTRKKIKNYIGGNSFLEMGFAHVLAKKIYLLNPIPKLDLYRDEIKAMEPVILNGDLANIKLLFLETERPIKLKNE